MILNHKTIEAYTPSGLDDAVNEFLEQEVAKLHTIRHQVHVDNLSNDVIFYAFITYEQMWAD